MNVKRYFFKAENTKKKYQPILQSYTKLTQTYNIGLEEVIQQEWDEKFNV